MTTTSAVLSPSSSFHLPDPLWGSPPGMPGGSHAPPPPPQEPGRPPAGSEQRDASAASDVVSPSGCTTGE